MTALGRLREHASALGVVVVAACVLGGMALTQLPSALYPEVSFPRIVIALGLPGSSAATLQRSASRPIEEALTSVVGVRRVRSRTIRSAAEISLWFDPDTDMDRALQLVNAKLAEVRGDLPRDVQLTVERLTASSFPLMSLAVTGAAPPAVLRDAALYAVRPRLAGLPGVGRVTVLGGDVREVEVIVDSARMEAAGLDLSKLQSALTDALPLEAVGRVDVHYQQQLVVMTGAAEDLGKLSGLVVGGTPELPVRLSDVARIEEGHEDRFSLTSAAGRPAALVNVGRRPGADALALATRVREELSHMQGQLPPGVEVAVTYDQTDLIGKAVGHVRDAVLLGGVLTLVIVALFLRSWAGTLAAAAALPATMLMTFGVMRLAGSSMNLMSLGGLAVAIGLVVDDAVVVVEAVHRRVVSGMEPWTATSEALHEIAWPVTHSTITTVVVFAPLSLLTGVSGQFFAALALTLCVAVLLSLAVALLVTPLLCGWLLKPGTHRPMAGPAWYGAALKKAVAWPGRTLAVAVLAIAVLALVGTGVGTGFLPELDEGSFVVDYFTPTGTSLAEADRIGAQVEAVISQEPEVQATSRRLGAELGPPTATESSRGDITVTLKGERDRATEEVTSATRKAVASAVPGARVEFVELLQDMLSDLEGNPEPVEVKLLGPDVAVLRELGPKVAEKLRGIEGLADLYDGVAGCAPELRVEVDPSAAGRLGLSARQVTEQVRTALLGNVVAQVPRANRVLGVRLRLDDRERFDPAVLSRLRIRPQGLAPVPLSALARLTPMCLPSELLSDNLRPLVSVTGRLEGRDLGAVTSEVEQRLQGFKLPPGVELVLGGQRQSQRESFRSLALVLTLAAFGVFAILAFHFRSLVLPLLILGAVPVALAAGVAVLRVTGVPLNVSSFMGCILLVGLVVKNGILLLDHAEHSRREGHGPQEAVVTAAGVRLRPILMTTLATLLGLVPLALGLGTGAELQRPLAITVIGGLFISTVAVLLALPAAYVAVSRRKV